MGPCTGGLEQNLLHPFSPEAQHSPPPKQEKEKKKSRFAPPKSIFLIYKKIKDFFL
jgi:hypothetical protein